MGWSCRADAAATMDKWTAACRVSTGSQNTWKEGGAEYFWDLSNTEHDDGAITGTILRTVPGSHQPDGSFKADRVGSFRINGDGSIARAPAFLKRAAQ